MMDIFRPLITNKVPFTEHPDINKASRFRPNPPRATATFLQPKLICEVSYTELTSDGVMRHPSFKGMRMDKKASQVTLEAGKPTEKIVKKAKKLIAPAKSRDRKTLPVQICRLSKRLSTPKNCWLWDMKKLRSDQP